MNSEKLREELSEFFDTEIKDMTQAYNRKAKENKKHHNNELSEMYGCALRKVHKKNMAKRKPRYEGLSLEEALAEYYG